MGDPEFSIFSGSSRPMGITSFRYGEPRYSVFVVIVYSRSYFGEVNREHLGRIVIHQVHLLSAVNNYERVRTSPNNVSVASAIAIHRIGSGYWLLKDIAVEIERLIRDKVTFTVER
jgi:hypothetical protein